MRIIKFLLGGLVFAAIGSAIVFFAGREMLMVWSMAQMRTSISILKQIDKNPRAYALQCRQKGVTVETDVIDKLQLRFISDNEYVVEVVCAQFSLDPIIIERKTLPQFVTKLPGNTGIIWGDAPSGVGLFVLGRERAVVVEEGEIFYTPIIEDFRYGVGPLSTCQAYGFECCHTDIQIGQGDQFNGVSDCPDTCHSQCVNRPVVLSFTSDPFMDIKTRITTVQSGDQVTFSYVVDNNEEGQPAQVELVTGDGQSYNSDQSSGSFTHSYKCATGNCSYRAVLSLINSVGIESAVLPINTINIRVVD